MPAARAATGTIDGFIGVLAGKTNKIVTVEEMNEIAAAGWAGEAHASDDDLDARRTPCMQDQDLHTAFFQIRVVGFAKAAPASSLKIGDTIMTNRARAAIEGKFDPADLTPEERSFYYALLDNVMANPTPERIAAAEARGMRPGAVGYDADGRLVRRLANGNLEEIGEDPCPKLDRP